MSALILATYPSTAFVSMLVGSPGPETWIPLGIAAIAAVPGVLAWLSGRKQESSKATREDFDALRAAYREDNQELRERVAQMEDDRIRFQERMQQVEKNEEVCTRRLSWLLGKLNIPLSDLDKGMQGEPLDITQRRL